MRRNNYQQIELTEITLNVLQLTLFSIVMFRAFVTRTTQQALFFVQLFEQFLFYLTGIDLFPTYCDQNIKMLMFLQLLFISFSVSTFLTRESSQESIHVTLLFLTNFDSHLN